MLRFWIPGVPHTRQTPQFSHCAFTTKTRLLPRLLKEAFPDCHITYCGVIGDTLPFVDSYTPVMSSDDWERFFSSAHVNERAFVGTVASVNHPGYRAFNAELGASWANNVRPGDVVCFPFGHAHAEAWRHANVQGALPVETGIGYPKPFLPFRIYESQTWMHYVAGREAGYKEGIKDGADLATGCDHAHDFDHIKPCEGSDYHFVAPHYYNPTEWRSRAELGVETSGDIVYMGRIALEKGMAVLCAVANAMPMQRFVMYGQGDPEPWLSRAQNLRYGGVLHGENRNHVLARAEVVLCPTRYIEPFCQTHVEALLSGTPVIGSAHSVFLEHYEQRTLGLFTARTLPDWVRAINTARQVFRFDDGRSQLRARALQRFAIEAVAPLYRKIITTMLGTLEPSGWYGPHWPVTTDNGDSHER